MFRVDQRYLGQGQWSLGAPPMTIQAAVGRAVALENTKFADDVRIVPAGPYRPFIDIRV